MTIIGWGNRSGLGSNAKSVILIEARVRTMVQKNCRKAFHWHPITKSMVCAATRAGSSGSCFVSLSVNTLKCKFKWHVML
jgi:hypothetical protein